MRRVNIMVWFLLGTVVTAGQLDMDVMSFNIRTMDANDGPDRWQARKARVADLIRDQAPDVIGVQEAHVPQLDYLTNRVPAYGVIGEGRDGGQRGETSAILYRTERFDVDRSGTFWLSDTPDVPSRHWGNACIRICTWARLVDKTSRQPVYVYNTHLDHVSQPSREKSVRLICDRIAHRSSPDPFLLTGDFNAGEDNPAIRYLIGAGAEEAKATIPAVVDTFRILHPRRDQVGTFHGLTGRTEGEKIDYIFVPAGTTVLRAEILHTAVNGRFPSDHFPVTARVRLTSVP